jgi:hypothetical protein
LRNGLLQDAPRTIIEALLDFARFVLGGRDFIR